MEYCDVKKSTSEPLSGPRDPITGASETAISNSSSWPTVLDHDGLVVGHLSPRRAESTASNTSKSQCRICYLTESECSQGGALVPCGCQCTGSTRYAHVTCMQEWVDHKGSNICEICGDVMNVSVSSYRTHTRREVPEGDLLYFLGDEPEFRRTSRPNTDERMKNVRVCAASVLLAIVIMTTASAIYTLLARNDLLVHHNYPLPIGSDPDLEKQHSKYGIGLSILVFAVSFTISLALVWFLTELYLMSDRNYRERRRRQMLEEQNNMMEL